MHDSVDVNQHLENSGYFDRVDSMIAHIENYIGPVIHTFMDLTDSHVVTLLVVAPTSENAFFTLVTCSASLGEEEQPSDVDFLICLPGDWPVPLTEEELQNADDAMMYPMSIAAEIARFALNTPLQYGSTVTIPAAESSPFPQFVSFLIAPPFNITPDACVMDPDNPASGILLGIYPLFAEEYRFKTASGTDDLLERLANNGVTAIFTPWRESVC